MSQTRIAPRTSAALLVATLLVGFVWRGVMAVRMPCLAKDGVTFCWYAQALERNGLEYLRRDSTQQHPAYPALILGVRWLARACGAPDGPMLWQRCGQGISLVTGLVVIGLSAALAARLARLDSALDPRLAACLAAGLAAIAPLYVELSADVLSDSLHLAWYLAAVLALAHVARPAAALTCGLAGGLAFATRPEGAVLLAGGAAAWLAAARAARNSAAKPVALLPRRLVLSGVLLVIGFAAVAAPFAWVMGRFAPKKDPAELLAAAWGAAPDPSALWLPVGPPSRPPSSETATGRLITFDLRWYEIPGFVAYMTFRAGRVVVPLLGLAGAALLWRRRKPPVLAGTLACFGLHAALLCLLLHRWNYLAPRHTLVLVALLLPFAGVALARGWRLAGEAPPRADLGPQPGGRRGALPAMLRSGALVLLAAPLAAYATRVPNGGDAHLRAAADWLIANDPRVRGKFLTGENSEKRVAFYAEMAWDTWLDDPRDVSRIRATTLARKPDYFALDTRREGESALMQALQADPELGPRMKLAFQTGSSRGGQFRIFALRW